MYLSLILRVGGIMEEMKLLLEKRWILKAKDKELYYRIKDKSREYRKFFEEKLGYHLFINPYAIKLEKIPGKAEEWMGIEEFDDRREYAILSLILMFLEDKGEGEQFVLSQITDYVQNAYPESEYIDWTKYQDRRQLVKVLRFCSKEGLFKIDDGDEGEFAGNETAEVLYESLGTSRYFMMNFTEEISGYTSWTDFENNELIDIDTEKGVIRRNRVYRKIFMSPIVYRNNREDADYDYIKKNRSVIENDVSKYLGGIFQVYKNGALVVFDEDKNFKNTFPQNNNISDIVLQMTYEIRSRVKNNIFFVKNDDTIDISQIQFEKLLETVREKYSKGWGKTYRELTFTKLLAEVTIYMKKFNMIVVNESTKEVKVMPLAGRITGQYPKDFNK